MSMFQAPCCWLCGAHNHLSCWLVILFSNQQQGLWYRWYLRVINETRAFCGNYKLYLSLRAEAPTIISPPQKNPKPNLESCRICKQFWVIILSSEVKTPEFDLMCLKHVHLFSVLLCILICSSHQLAFIVCRAHPYSVEGIFSCVE